MNEKLPWLPKLTLIAVGGSVAYKPLIWAMGLHTNADAATSMLFGLLTFADVREAFAWIGFIGFDLVILSTVLNMRQHGPTKDGIAAMVTAAIVAALIGLDVSNVISAPALYAASAVTLLVYGLHLGLDGWRSKTERAERTSLEAERQKLAAERSALEAERQELRTTHHADAWETRAQQHELNAAQWRTEAERLRTELDEIRTRPALPEPSDETALTIGGRPYSLATIAKITGVSKSTIAERLKKEAGHG